MTERYSVGKEDVKSAVFLTIVNKMVKSYRKESGYKTAERQVMKIAEALGLDRSNTEDLNHIVYLLERAVREIRLSEMDKMAKVI